MRARRLSIREKSLVLVGVSVRLLFLSIVVPRVQESWFLPFLRAALETKGADPWTTWVSNGGDVLAFPYGIVMIMVAFPVFVLQGAPLIADSSFVGAFFVIDLLVLQKVRGGPDELWRTVAWALSPLAVYLTYIHGQTDLIVGFSILLAMRAIRRESWSYAGVCLGLGSLTKLSVLLPIPALVIFALTNRGSRRGLARTIAIALVIFALGSFPALYSPGYRDMVFGSKEISGLLRHSVTLGADTEFLLMPTIFAALLFTQYRQKRQSYEALALYVVAGIASVVILAPSSNAWHLWVLPSFIGFMPRLTRVEQSAFIVLQVAVVFRDFFGQTQGKIRFGGEPLIGGPPGIQISDSVLATVVLVLGAAVYFSVLSRGIRTYNPLDIGRRRVSIAIAGNSGVGKDTLVKNLISLFPAETVQTISGDDYHLFERGAEQWRTMTHLNPSANDLLGFRRDVSLLLNGQGVQRRNYDHHDGRFVQGDKLEPGDILLVNGLHAFYVESETLTFDLKLFLSMDEPLRLALKGHRDSTQRNATAASVLTTEERRSQDAMSFISPQTQVADLNFHLSVIDHETLMSPIELRIDARNLRFVEQLHFELQTKTRAPNSLKYDVKHNSIVLTLIADELTTNDLASIGRGLYPDAAELRPEFLHLRDGSQGLITLATLLAMAEVRARSE